MFSDKDESVSEWDWLGDISSQSELCLFNKCPICFFFFFLRNSFMPWNAATMILHCGAKCQGSSVTRETSALTHFPNFRHETGCVQDCCFLKLCSVNRIVCLHQLKDCVSELCSVMSPPPKKVPHRGNSQARKQCVMNSKWRHLKPAARQIRYSGS